MDYMGGLSSISQHCVVRRFSLAGVMKVFQMATTLSEIKDVLTAIKLNAPIQPAAGSHRLRSGHAPLPSAQSGEDMLRAALSELDHPVNPTSIELGNKS